MKYKFRQALLVSLLGLVPTGAFADEKDAVSPEVTAEEKNDFDPLQPRFFQPSYRVYFDLGSDDPGELDIYQDGKLGPTINLVGLDYNIPLDEKRFILWGPSVGFGITAPADDSPDQTNTADDAPIVLLTAGVFVSFDIFGMKKGSSQAHPEEATSVAIESGIAYGISTDEGLESISDVALYFGLTVKYAF